MRLKLVITGRPVTKKNHQQIVMRKGRPRIVQHRAYYTYAHSAKIQLRSQYDKQPIDVPMSIEAKYYLPNRRGKPDLNNLMSATADILQDVKVIKDDCLILNWDGSCIAGIDKDNPRVEVHITTTPGLLNSYIDLWGKI